jgi:hypothetical protein
LSGVSGAGGTPPLPAIAQPLFAFASRIDCRSIHFGDNLNFGITDLKYETEL